MAEQLANLNNKPSLIAACQQSGIQATGKKIDLAKRLIESGVDLSNITYLILSMDSISEEDLNLSYVPEDNRSPEATDNLENSPHQEDEYNNRGRNRTLDLSMFKQLSEFKRNSDPEIFKDNFMRCVVLSGLQVSDPRATMWLLLRVEDTVQRRLKDTFPKVDNENAATLLGTLTRWYGKKMKAEEAGNQLLTFEVREEQIKTSEDFRKMLKYLKELIEAKFFDLSTERRNEMYKFEMIKLFRGLGHLKGLSEYGINYGIPMLETEALRINENFQRSHLRRMTATTTPFQGNCYTCGKTGHRSYQCKESVTKNEGKGKNNVKTMLIKESKAKEVQQLLDLIRMDDEISDNTDDHNRMLTISEVTNMVNHEKTEVDDILQIKMKRQNDKQGRIYKMLADTGSNRTILSESALSKLLKNKKNDTKGLKIKKNFLKGLGDTIVTSHAFIKLDLEFENQKTSTNVLILKDKDILAIGDYDGIIGKQTLKELGMKLTLTRINQNCGETPSCSQAKRHKEKINIKRLNMVLKHLGMIIQNCKVYNKTDTSTQAKRKTGKIPQKGHDFGNKLTSINTYMNYMPGSTTNIAPTEVMPQQKTQSHGNDTLSNFTKPIDEWELDKLINRDHIETPHSLKIFKQKKKENRVEELPTYHYDWQRKLYSDEENLERPNQTKKLKEDEDGFVCVNNKGTEDGDTKRKLNVPKHRHVSQRT